MKDEEKKKRLIGGSWNHLRRFLLKQNKNPSQKLSNGLTELSNVKTCFFASTSARKGQRPTFIGVRSWFQARAEQSGTRRTVRQTGGQAPDRTMASHGASRANIPSPLTSLVYPYGRPWLKSGFQTVTARGETTFGAERVPCWSFV